MLTRVLIGIAVYFALSAAQMLSLPTEPTQIRAQPLSYDRVQFIDEFVRAIYPDIADKQGLVTVRAFFDRDPFHYMQMSIHFCEIGSSVRGRSSTRQTPLPGNMPCRPERTSSVVLADIDIVALFGPKDPPLTGYTAKGKFVDDQLKAVLDNIKDDASWTDAQWLAALRSKNPKYGPDDRDLFLKIIPVHTVEEFTGCRLRPDIAQFLTRLSENVEPILSWRVEGNTRDNGRCAALFEPFGGHLTRL